MQPGEQISPRAGQSPDEAALPHRATACGNNGCSVAVSLVEETLSSRAEQVPVQCEPKVGADVASNASLNGSHHPTIDPEQEKYPHTVEHFNGVWSFEEPPQVFLQPPSLIDTALLSLKNNRGEVVATIKFAPLLEAQCREITELFVRLPSARPFTEPNCKNFEVISKSELATFLAEVRSLNVKVEEGIFYKRGKPLTFDRLYDLSDTSIQRFSENYYQKIHDDRYVVEPKIRIYDVLPVVPPSDDGNFFTVEQTLQSGGSVEKLEGFRPPPKAIVEKKGFRWIDIEAPDPELIGELDERFGFMPDCLSDCLAFEQETTVKEYGDHFFIVTHAFSSDAQDPTHPEPLEVHAFVSDNLLVTVHADHIGAINKIADQVRKADFNEEEKTPWDLYAALSDAFITSNWPVLERIKPSLGKLQVQAQRRGLSNKQLQEELPSLTETLVEMDKVFTQQSRVFRELGKLGRKTIPRPAARRFAELGQEAELLDQKITDQQRVIENITSTSELISQKRNAETNKSLAFLVAASLPYGMFFAFGGMNFTNLPFNSPTAFFGGLIGASVLTSGMLWWGLRTKIIKVPGTRSKE